jgi:hypothetical protein
MLGTVWGFSEKAREVIDIIKGRRSGVNEVHVMCLLQALQALATESGHSLKLLLEDGEQARHAACALIPFSNSHFQSAHCVSGLLAHPSNTGDQKGARHGGGSLPTAYEAQTQREWNAGFLENPAVRREGREVARVPHD